ncbi:MAG: hypothetical protein M3N93_03525 [Acidobacteriota bacterium]|nr:hypothetical protein [Acidobacteriota bacterium]
MIFLLIAIDLAGSYLGIRFMQMERVRGWALSLSSGVLAAIALLWMLPEMGRVSGLPNACSFLFIGLAVLFAIDRFVYPVCPCCTHLSRKPSAGGELQRMTWPMLAGICIHNVFDGWTTAVAVEARGATGAGLLAGTLIHKLPESLILGVLLRSATRRSSRAFFMAVFASFFLLVGGIARNFALPFQSGALLMVSLAIAAASFLFIGVHTFRAECSRTGARPAMIFLLAGFGCAAALQGIVQW